MARSEAPRVTLRPVAASRGSLIAPDTETRAILGLRGVGAASGRRNTAPRLRDGGVLGTLRSNEHC
jgi:hypothetical protein